VVLHGDVHAGTVLGGVLEMPNEQFSIMHCLTSGPNNRPCKLDSS
jgi:hypothetical protein